MIWVPFTVAVAEDGTVKVAGIDITKQIHSYAVYGGPGSELEVKIAFDKSNVDFSIEDKWLKLYWPGRIAGQPYIEFRHARWIWSDTQDNENCVLSLDDKSEVTLPDGLTVLLNMVPPVKSS